MENEPSHLAAGAEQAEGRGPSLTALGPGPKWPELANCRHAIDRFDIVPAAEAVTQMGERRNRTAEVRGSNPLGSTSPRSLYGL